MNQSNKHFADFRDIAHAAVLLILVPIVFYGGFLLVSRAATTKAGNPSDLVESAPEKLNQVKEYLLNQSSPPPGTTWIAAIDRQREKLSSISLTEAIKIEQRSRLEEQLNLIRQHCQTFPDDVPNEIGPETHLGRTFVRLANEIDRLQNSLAQTQLPLGWESEYEARESKRLAQQASKVNVAFQQQAAPLRKALATQLAAMKRHNRELADEIQRTIDNINRIERESREQFAKRQRLQAYAKDKDEIERLLKPFITPGYSQPRDSWNDWKQTTEKEPLSYRDLERLGALATDIKGIRTFARMGGVPTHMSPNSARPLGSFPAYYDHTLSNSAQLETIKRAQQLIKQHSVYLIEAGLLQP